MGGAMTDEERVTHLLDGYEPYVAANGKAWWDFAFNGGRGFLFLVAMNRLEGGQGRSGGLARKYNSRREAIAAARAAVLRCIQEGEL